MAVHLDIPHESRTLHAALNYNFPNDTVEVYIFTRNHDGRVIEAAEPMVMSPHTQGSQLQPCIVIPQSHAEFFIRGLNGGMDRMGVNRKGTEADARLALQQRHLEDLRHLLKIRGVEKL